MIPTPEYRFHPTRRWRFDWAFPDVRIAVEWDGFSDHVSLKGVLRDSEKINEAQVLGWIVIRVNAISFKDGSAHDIVQRAMSARGLTTIGPRDTV